MKEWEFGALAEDSLLQKLLDHGTVSLGFGSRSTLLKHLKAGKAWDGLLRKILHWQRDKITGPVKEMLFLMSAIANLALCCQCDSL